MKMYELSNLLFIGLHNRQLIANMLLNSAISYHLSYQDTGAVSLAAITGAAIAIVEIDDMPR